VHKQIAHSELLTLNESAREAAALQRSHRLLLNALRRHVDCMGVVVVLLQYLSAAFLLHDVHYVFTSSHHGMHMLRCAGLLLLLLIIAVISVVFVSANCPCML
jgi:hypothetical protein